MKTKFFTLILLMLLVFYANSTLASEGHDDETPSDDHGDETMGEHEAADQCETPTYEINIIGGENAQITFDQTKYYVPLDTCVEVIFANLDIIEHDVSIDEIHDSIEKVHLHLSNNTDGHEGDGVISMHMQTPNFDTEYDIYCSVPGHKAAGMTATLIVGEGLPEDESFLPGFGFFALFISMSTLILFYRKKNN